MKIINAATERSTLFNVNNPNFPEREPSLFEFLKYFSFFHPTKMRDINDIKRPNSKYCPIGPFENECTEINTPDLVMKVP